MFTPFHNLHNLDQRSLHKWIVGSNQIGVSHSKIALSAASRRNQVKKRVDGNYSDFS